MTGRQGGAHVASMAALPGASRRRRCIHWRTAPDPFSQRFSIENIQRGVMVTSPAAARPDGGRVLARRRGRRRRRPGRRARAPAVLPRCPSPLAGGREGPPLSLPLCQIDSPDLRRAVSLPQALPRGASPARLRLGPSLARSVAPRARDLKFTARAQNLQAGPAVWPQIPIGVGGPHRARARTRPTCQCRTPSTSLPTTPTRSDPGQAALPLPHDALGVFRTCLP
jgi:hypothetical protein